MKILSEMSRRILQFGSFFAANEGKKTKQGNDISDVTLNGIMGTAQLEAYLKMQLNKYASFFFLTQQLLNFVL